MNQQRRFVIICSSEVDLTDAPEQATEPDAPHAAYVRRLAASLTRLGHETEIWTVLRDGQSPREAGPGGAVIRRFPGQRDYLVPRLRPCWWVSEWVTCATAEFAKSADLSVTLVTFHWEAGVAGRLLSQRFGFDLIHFPAADGGAPASTDSAAQLAGALYTSRQNEEERETRRHAAALLAIASPPQPYDTPLPSAHNGSSEPRRVVHVPPGPDLGSRFIAALPRPSDDDERRDASSARATLASLVEQDDCGGGHEREFEPTPVRRRRTWNFELEVARSAMTGRHVMF